MISGPRVSIVLIFLDAKPFLSDAVDSVLAQSCADWDLWLVDDGSTDGSTAIAKAYEGAHPNRVHYLEHPGHENRGMSASRNLGLAHAAADYVAFIDADDAWMPTKLEDQVAILDAHPEAAMVFGALEVWHSWTGRPDDVARDHPWRFFGVPLDSVVPPPALIPLILRYGSSPCPSLVMVRKAAALRVGGFDPSFRTMYEDEVFYSKIWLRDPVFVSSRCWARRRQHPGACTTLSDSTGQSRAHRVKYLTWLEQFLIEQDARGSAVWTALQEQLDPYRPAGPRPAVSPLRAGVAKVAAELGLAAARLVGRRAGTLSAAPNPIRLHESGSAVTTLTWRSANTSAVELRLGAPDGPLVSHSGPSGRVVTGDWVNNGMLFYLQDASASSSSGSALTLATLRVGLLP